VGDLFSTLTRAPRLLTGFLYCSIALACALVKMCCACSGKESICFLVLLDNIADLPGGFLLEDFLSLDI
jgi:hypothetical protein